MSASHHESGETIPLTIVSPAPEATLTLGRRLGRSLGRCLGPGLIIALHGDLGSGKTTFTQGLAQGLGLTQPITSPTFTFVNEYAIPSSVPNPAASAVEPSALHIRHLIHIDLYRLPETPEAAILEAATFGLDEILDTAAEGWAGSVADTVVIIEWAERIAPVLPIDHLRIEIRHGAHDEPATRTITLHAGGPRARKVLQSLAADNSD